MIIFKKLRLRNLLFYEDQTFDLATPGIRLILGKNLNSSSDNPNGAGKSLFFSQLPELLLNEQLHGTRRDVTREGSVSIAFSVESTNYVAIRAFSPRETLRIAREGKDMGFRELSESRAFLTKLIPYTSDEVRSLLHLDSQLPHPLITGDTVQRKNFFTSFFKLGVLEVMRKKVRAELSSIKESAAALEELRATAKLLREQVDPSCEAKTLALKTLTQERDLLQGQMADWVAAEAANLRLVALEPTLSYLKKKGLLDDEECVSHWKELKISRKDHAAKLAAVVAYSTWKSELARLPDVDSKSLREESSKIKSKLDAADLSDFNSKERALLDKQLLNARDKLKELKAAAETCPTCGAPYDNKHAAVELAKVREALAALKNKFAKLPVSTDDALTTEEYEELEIRLDKISSLRATAARRTALLESAPTKVEEVTEAELESEIANLDRSLRLMQDYPAALDALKDSSRFKSLDAESLSAAQSTFVDLSNRYNRLYAEVEKSKAAATQLSALRPRAAVLKERLKDKEALGLLENAFSRKGVESLMIKSLCDSLAIQINKYSRLLFPEDYQFSLELETQFAITVTRKYGKKVVSSDVRKLSGAEKKLFALVLLVSLMTFVPKSRRSNLLILDEPTAAMGPENVSRFVRFLPMLQAVIPSIVVITPLDPREYLSINPKVFTVIKDRKGVSRIEETK
jgi:DNA repair exonuclease SbcCD ATPase subunit